MKDKPKPHTLSRVLRLICLLLRSELTAVSDDDLLLGSTTLRADISHCLDDLSTRSDLTENYVLSVKVRGGAEGNEELRSIGVLASVSH